jgi:rod shape-determining protein MreD
MQLSITSREQLDVYRFSWPVVIVLPLFALFLQATLPKWFPFFQIFDLPLLITIFLAVARRNPVSGLMTGALIGLAQDALTHRPIGMYGIAKTVIGYAASSLGVKLDVENPGSRLLITCGFYVVHELIYFSIARGLVHEVVKWSWRHEVLSGFANAIFAVFLFHLFDRLKQR